MPKSTGKKLGKSVGKIVHYFDHIGVAALVLSAPLKVGDTVTIRGHDKEFTQTVSSMQINRQSISKAKKGDDVAIKVDQPTKEKDEVFKVTA